MQLMPCQTVRILCRHAMPSTVPCHPNVIMAASRCPNAIPSSAMPIPWQWGGTMLCRPGIACLPQSIGQYRVALEGIVLGQRHDTIMTAGRAWHWAANAMPPNDMLSPMQCPQVPCHCVYATCHAIQNNAARHCMRSPCHPNAIPSSAMPSQYHDDTMAMGRHNATQGSTGGHCIGTAPCH